MIPYLDALPAEAVLTLVGLLMLVAVVCLWRAEFSAVEAQLTAKANPTTGESND